jgi:hypothetical protein
MVSGTLTRGSDFLQSRERVEIREELWGAIRPNFQLEGVEILAARARASHPCAENAQEWGTLFVPISVSLVVA